ncbi:hypothetical protein TNCV_1672101 [Trichonephila clavipes]|nr:hypothetical protein TNCV_1672101 [Trichonephila clavipes]
MERRNMALPGVHSCPGLRLSECPRGCESTSRTVDSQTPGSRTAAHPRPDGREKKKCLERRNLTPPKSTTVRRSLWCSGAV